MLCECVGKDSRFPFFPLSLLFCGSNEPERKEAGAQRSGSAKKRERKEAGAQRNRNTKFEMWKVEGEKRRKTKKKYFKRDLKNTYKDWGEMGSKGDVLRTRAKKKSTLDKVW